MLYPHRQFPAIAFLLTAAVTFAFAQSSSSPAAAGNYTTNYATWSDYGGSADAAQYSSLNQINRSNVTKLRQAWSYSTADARRYFFTPLVVDDVIYVLAQNNSILALNAATGEEIWAHAPDPGTRAITNRGINYWQSEDGSERRLLYAANHYLRALDARTGRPIDSFGAGGLVNLKEGLGRDPKTFSIVQSYSPGRVFKDLLILGSATNEGYGSAPGDIRAFDVRTGRQVWSFHTIPHPGELGYDTWPPDAWKTVGGANVWSELALDVERGIVYAPVASAKYNFFGGDREGANLFSNTLLALDARSGKRVWHFQLVHHDIWDYDPATAPKLLTVQHQGKPLDVVAQATKQGFVFVFDRVTGEPLWPIEERPVPTDSEMPREKLWPTQPFPTKPPPFARQSFTGDDLNPYLDPAERERYRRDILAARNEGLYTPLGRGDTIQMPGNNGGANWGGAAVDPTRGLLYVVSKDHPAMLKLDLDGTQQPPASDEPEVRRQYLYDVHCHTCHSIDSQENARALSSLLGVAERLSRAELSNVIREGVGPMPAFGSLPDRDIELLVDFLENPTPLSAAARNREGQLSDSPRFVSGFGLMRASNGLSPIGPPWSTLTAYDLNQGTILWQVPLGETPQLAAQGAKDTGAVYPKTGPVATAGGLIFAGTRDKKVRAYNTDTGKVMWEAEVDAALEGIPAVYQVDGRQYIVFCAAGQSGLTKQTEVEIQGAYVAFALPD